MLHVDLVGKLQKRDDNQNPNDQGSSEPAAPCTPNRFPTAHNPARRRRCTAFAHTGSRHELRALLPKMGERSKRNRAPCPCSLSTWGGGTLSVQSAQILPLILAPATHRCLHQPLSGFRVPGVQGCGMGTHSRAACPPASSAACRPSCQLHTVGAHTQRRYVVQTRTRTRIQARTTEPLARRPPTLT